MTADFLSLVDATGQPEAGAPLGALISAQAALIPDAPAVTANGITWSFTDLDRASNRRARWLAAQAVVQDDLVFIALPNGLAFYECVFAVWKLGATPGHVSYRLAAPEFEAILQLGRPKLVIGEVDFPGVVRPGPMFPTQPCRRPLPHPGRFPPVGGAPGGRSLWWTRDPQSGGRTRRAGAGIRDRLSSTRRRSIIAGRSA